jgi:hypothetical protein
MKNCARCGVQNLDDAGFCANCGGAFTPESEVQGTPAPPPAPFGTSPQAGIAPPPSPYGQPPAGYPPQAPLTGVPYAPVSYPMMAQITNSKATASLVLGIIGIFMCPVVCSVIAIILGSMAKSEIAASGGYQTGESNAKAGIILGWIGLALAAVSVMIVVIAVIVAAASAAALPVSAILVLV